MAPHPSTYLLILNRAITEELGVVVPTNNITYLAERLYKAKRESGDPALADLGIIKAGTDRLFVVRKSVELEG